MDERASPQDLIYGAVREPVPPLSIGQEKLVSRLYDGLNAYVTPRGLGRLWTGIEVVLDRREGLVLKPDIIFIVEGRESIAGDRVWGAPDMVLEVTPPLVHSGALQERVHLFSLYGVREYWLVQPDRMELAILELGHGGVRQRMLFDERTSIKSPLLPEFDRTLSEMFV